jgi:hypothetical protein
VPDNYLIEEHWWQPRLLFGVLAIIVGVSGFLLIDAEWPQLIAGVMAIMGMFLLLTVVPWRKLQKFGDRVFGTLFFVGFATVLVAAKVHWTCTALVAVILIGFDIVRIKAVGKWFRGLKARHQWLGRLSENNQDKITKTI